MGLRRHLPAQRVDVHLRAGLPGRAHRPRARARAGVLLLRRPLHRRRRREAGEEDRGHAHRRAVAVPQAGPGARHHQAGRRGATVSRLVQDAVHLPEPTRASPPARAARCTWRRCSTASGRSTYKPEVCWQLPLRREDNEDEDGHVTSTIIEWQRRNWGDGGYEFHWWCTEAPEAFVGATPVYRTMRDELIELVGKRVYAPRRRLPRRPRQPAGDASSPTPPCAASRQRPPRPSQ